MEKKQFVNTVIMLVITAALVFGIGAVTKPEPVSYTPGVYYAQSKGNEEGLWVKVSVSETEITGVEVIENHETVGICEPALEQVPANILQYQTYAVSAVSGATKTSEGIKNAVANALEQAAGKAEIVIYTPPAPKEDPVPLGYTYKPGTYTASAEGFEGNVTATVVFDESSIVSVEFSADHDTKERVDSVRDSVPAAMLQWQTYEVDAASGATWTSKGLIDAVKACVEQAKVD